MRCAFFCLCQRFDLIKMFIHLCIYNCLYNNAFHCCFIYKINITNQCQYDLFGIYCPPGGQYDADSAYCPVGAIRLRATPIAPWGQYGSVLRLLPRGGNTAPRPPLAGMAVARRDANDYFLLWRSHSMALMRNVLLSSSL